MTERPRKYRRASLLFPAAIGLGAFLLFQIQFILGKLILPWFGGAPAVWTTCMLFFQAALLAGYAYAHGAVRFLSPRRQRAAHLAFLGGTALLLAIRAFSWPSPITPGASWKPGGTTDPAGEILWLLTAASGAVFALVASTSPLLQAWFSRVAPGISPYRLYGLSNLGSLLGLLTYPVLVEPFLSVPGQGWVWTALFLVYAALCAICAWWAGRTSESGSWAGESGENRFELKWREAAVWFSLSAIPSVLLLAITSQLTQEVAVIPFLWVLPLTLYLVTFILCFEFERSYHRGVFLPLFAAAALGAAVLLHVGVGLKVYLQILILNAVLFVFSMVCHGELVRRKPAVGGLTAFYLAIAAGGVAGGLFNGVLAPWLFLGLWELPAGLVLGAAVVLGVLFTGRESWLREGPVWPFFACAVLSVFVFALTHYTVVPQWFPRSPGKVASIVAGISGVCCLLWYQIRKRVALGRLHPAWGLAAGIVAIACLGGVFVRQAFRDLGEAMHVSRNFFGVLRVIGNTAGTSDTAYLSLRHGRITHGIQPLHPLRRREPSSYYGPRSGAGLAMRYHERHGQPGFKAGLVGLGVGTLASYSETGQSFRFYEINPDVLALSESPFGLFTYVSGAKGNVKLILGDARLSLEREPAQNFDVLALDAFSSDSIPVHLLTTEAFDIYIRHLRNPEGILAVHISNRYLDLEPVLAAQAKRLNLKMLKIEAPAEGDFVWSTDWVLIARPRALSAAVFDAAAFGWTPKGKEIEFTDQYSNLFRLLK